MCLLSWKAHRYGSSKSKQEYLEKIVNQNPSDKNVKILLTEDLVNEIHLYNKGKSSALKIVGIGVITVYVIAGLAAVLLLVALGG